MKDIRSQTGYSGFFRFVCVCSGLFMFLKSQRKIYIFILKSQQKSICFILKSQRKIYIFILKSQRRGYVIPENRKDTQRAFCIRM